MMRFAGRVSMAASLVAGLAFGFALASPVHAEDAAKVKQLYDEGMGALEKGDFDTALGRFKALFQEDPNQAQILDLIRSTETKHFLRMLEKGGEYEQAARRFLSMGHAAARERSADEERIRPLVESAVRDGDLEKRRMASRQIMADHGAFAIPLLVPYLGSNDTDERVRAIFVLEDVGVEAVQPLVEIALNSPDAQVRQSAIIALRRLADPRAYPVLDWIARAKENPDSVRRAAEAAVKAYPASFKPAATPEEGFLKLADAYYTKAPDVLRDIGAVNTLWKWEEGKLHSKAVPAMLYHLRLAEKACGMALAANPASAVSRQMLAVVYAAQQVALAGAPADFAGTDAGKEEAARLAMADAAIRSGGVAVVDGALRMALKYNDAPVAIALLRALPTYAGVPMDDKSGLVGALTAPDQRIQWHAALTAVRLAPAKAFPRSDLVVSLASDAVALASIRQILVIADDTKTAVQLQTELNAAGMHAVVARSGADGLVRTKQAPFDAVVVAAALKDMMAQQVVNEIRRDYRTKATPVLVAAPEAGVEGVKTLLGDSVAGVLSMPLSANVYVPVVKEAASRSPLDDRARALAMSEEACGVLADASPSAVFDFTKAQAALVGTLNTDKPDSLKLKALAALRKWGGDPSLAGLVDAVALSTNSEAVRSEAAAVAGLKLSGKAPAQKAYEVLLGGLSDASVPVRTACAGALGSCKLTDAQKNEVLAKAKL